MTTYMLAVSGDEQRAAVASHWQSARSAWVSVVRPRTWRFPSR